MRKLNDDGLTLVQILIYIVLAGVVGTLVATLVVGQVKTGEREMDRAETHTKLITATSILDRDLTEARALLYGDDKTFTVNVIRYEKCVQRTWAVKGKDLSLETTYFPGRDCFGAGETGSEVMFTGLSSNSLFTYFNDQNPDPRTTPLNVPEDIVRVGWNLEAPVKNHKSPVVDASEVALNVYTETPGKADKTASGKKPDLVVTTHEKPGKAEGKDQPILEWTDNSPSFTRSWVVYRSVWWEGEPENGRWEVISNQAINTFTDEDLTRGLKNGQTAAYYVRAVGPDGQLGPASDQVITGLRPLAPTVLETQGKPTSIVSSWTASRGTTTWDVYRQDGANSWARIATGLKELPAGSADVIHNGNRRAWEDLIGQYGNAHNYKVVAVNRWEAKALTKPETTRFYSPVSGDFTAPAAPAKPTLTANADWSFTVGHGFTGWTGYGPTSKNGASRDKTWNTQASRTSGGTYTNAVTGTSGTTQTAKHTLTESTVGGEYRYYKNQGCNASGCGPLSEATGKVQRPKTPLSCVAAPATPHKTHQITATINPSPIDDTSKGYNLTGGTPATGHTVQGLGDQTAATYNLSRLAHDTAHTFTVKQRNTSEAGNGWSPTTVCRTTAGGTDLPRTDKLANPTITVSNVTTRSMVTTLSAANGGQFTTKLTHTTAPVTRYDKPEDRATSTTAKTTYDPIVHNRTYTIEGTNSDGYNKVAASKTQKTVLLATPTFEKKTVTTRQIKTTTAATNGSKITTTVSHANAPVTKNGVAEDRGPSTALSSTFDPLVQNRTYNIKAVNTDGWNDKSASTTAKTEALNAPTLTFSAVTTRSITAHPAAPKNTNTTTQWVRRGTGTYYQGATKFDPLAHNTTHSFTARNTDGWNSKTVDGSRATTRLANPAPISCYATNDGAHSPTAIKWVKSSHASWTSQPTWAASAGYYTARITATNSDGHNITRISDDCTAYFKPMPAPTTPSSWSFQRSGDSLKVVSNSSGAAGYEIQAQQMDSFGGWKAAGEVRVADGAFFSQYSLGQGGLPTQARIRAYNSSGYSGWSGWLSVTL